MEVLKCKYGIMAHVVYFMNQKYGTLASQYYIHGFLDFVSTSNGTFVCETAILSILQLYVR